MKKLWLYYKITAIHKSLVVLAYIVIPPLFYEGQPTPNWLKGYLIASAFVFIAVLMRIFHLSMKQDVQRIKELIREIKKEDE